MSMDAALRYAPIFRLDQREPFRPRQLGYTVLDRTQPSPSFLREVEIALPATQVIEYAVWWNWDIGHLLDLEHIWVYLNADGEVTGCEGSWHCFYRALDTALEGTHVVALVLPGKHGFGGAPESFADTAADTERACGPEAERSELLIPHLYLGRLHKDARDDALIEAYLQRRAFAPAWQFTERIEPASELLCPWSELEASIPPASEAWLARLRAGEV